MTKSPSEDIKQIYRVTPRGFAPANALAQDFLLKSKVGDLVELKGSRPRSLAHLRKWHALIHRVAEAAGYSDEDFIILVKVELEYFTWVKGPQDQFYRKYHSIAFHNMDQEEFDRFYARTIEHITERILPGMDLDYFRSEILDFA